MTTVKVDVYLLLQSLYILWLQNPIVILVLLSLAMLFSYAIYYMGLLLFCLCLSSFLFRAINMEKTPSPIPEGSPPKRIINKHALYHHSSLPYSRKIQKKALGM